ncbi:MAG: hypothetical protein SH847_20745 [Roseiflexaceae bacterium]|nr:hypothetical protein [Roseiflexaceae bacterium]
MSQGRWVFDPDRGGVRIPETIKRSTEAKLRQIAEAEFTNHYTRLDIRFRGAFCYIDAYAEDAFRVAARVYLLDV